MVYFFGITTYSEIFESNILIIHLDPENINTFWNHFNQYNLEETNSNSIHKLELYFLWQPLRKPVPFIPVINKTYLINILQKKIRTRFRNIKFFKKIKNLFNREINFTSKYITN